VGLDEHHECSGDTERRAALAEVATSLQEQGLGVEIEPVIGTTRPDLVATVQGGPAYIIEFKTGDGRAHFSLIAQLLTFVSVYAVARPARKAMAVLATTRDVPEHIRGVAEQAGVQIVKAPTVAALARRLVERIQPAL